MWQCSQRECGSFFPFFLKAWPSHITSCKLLLVSEWPKLYERTSPKPGRMGLPWKVVKTLAFWRTQIIQVKSELNVGNQEFQLCPWRDMKGSLLKDKKCKWGSWLVPVRVWVQKAQNSVINIWSKGELGKTLKHGGYRGEVNLYSRSIHPEESTNSKKFDSPIIFQLANQ